MNSTDCLLYTSCNAKGYTLTEYINDINRENTEVLAEYGADEKVRQAYTCLLYTSKQGLQIPHLENKIRVSSLMRTYKMKRRHQKIRRRRKNRQLQRKKQKKIRRKKKWS